ncbi:MAG: hypothetical protein IMZ64_04035 [Bacteroidetes bacterium]|nr:hypothetical protein [Bacteroidota bacterium]
MEQNLWVAAASRLAPGNLVVRQWALIDLLKGEPNNRDRIYNMMNILSYKQPGILRIFGEGYSYFNYTMDIVGEWVEKFNVIMVKNLVNMIEQGFISTSYIRKGVWYPAPFGDLRDIPLNPDLQISHDITNRVLSNVCCNSCEGRLWYTITGKPIGLNTHISKNDSIVSIKNGIPTTFKFYEGYDKKYKNSWEEFKDTFDLKRILSIPC